MALNGFLSHSILSNLQLINRELGKQNKFVWLSIGQDLVRPLENDSLMIVKKVFFPTPWVIPCQKKKRAEKNYNVSTPEILDPFFIR